MQADNRSAVSHKTESRIGNDSRETILTREFNAPRSAVFKAWTEPKLFAKWWGPHEFTVPVCQIDSRPGGTFRIVMRASDGTEYPLKGTFREVVAPERLVYVENWEEHPAEWHDMIKKNLPQGATMSSNEALCTVTFEERDGLTLQTVRTRFESAAVASAFMKTGMQDGWSQSFERLDDLLGQAG